MYRIGQRVLRVMILFALFGPLFVAGIGVQAQGEHTVYLPIVVGPPHTPGSSSVVVISADTAQEDILPAEEVALIETLQGTVAHALLSDVSPDGSTILVAGTTTAFVNITTGLGVSLSADFGNYTCLSSIVWRDATTAACLASDADGNTVLLALNSSDGSVTASDALTLPGDLYSLSPDASKVLVTIADASTALAAPPAPVVVAFPTLDNPDNGSIALTSTSTTFAVYDIATNQTSELLTLPPNSVLNGTPAWTTDGTQIAFTSTNYDRTDDDRSYTDPGDGTLINSVAALDVLGRISPEANPLLQTNRLHVFELAESGVLSQTLRAPGIDTFGGAPFEPAGQMDWSPDGTRLAVQVREPAQVAGRQHPVYTYPARSYFQVYTTTGSLSDTLQLAATIEAPQIAAQWVSDVSFANNDVLLFNAAYLMDVGLYTYSLTSTTLTDITPQPGTYGQAKASGDRVVFTYSSFTSAPEVYALNLDGSGLQALTSDNTAAQAANAVRADVISFTLESGLTHSGYLIQPADTPFPPQNARVIVWQQQGPSQGPPMSNFWSARVEDGFNLLPNFGYAVLVLPLYGREGFGAEDFNRLVENDNFGQVDIDAMAEVVQQMVEAGYTTPQRVGIMGCSYGSYFVTQSLVRHPDLYRAAHSQCNLLDLMVEWKRGFVYVAAYLEGRDPYSDPAEFIADSPLYQVAQVETP
ncbi:MAG: prolyl oligopeptidase family serine peptidase, partial [Chloroflexaceae bacterium]|nr:prolyl oligopeptidase family serine peptidase [Chloroflexaceae bacterium]